MRLLLDESVPSRLRRALPNHAVRTVGEMGWSGVKNGKLLALAAAGGQERAKSVVAILVAGGRRRTRR